MSNGKDFDIIKEFKLENLSAEKQTTIQQKLLDLIVTRFNRAVLNRMSEKDKQEFIKKLEQNQGVEEFVKNKVPDFAEIHQQIVEDLKGELVKLKEVLV